MKNSPNIGFNYYFFGSSDSLDIDIIIQHKDSTGKEEDTKIIYNIIEKMYSF
jgi:hypothetical protein